jgi:hypothetical protein
MHSALNLPMEKCSMERPILVAAEQLNIYCLKVWNPNNSHSFEASASCQMALISLALSKLTNSIPWTSQKCLAPNQSVCKTNTFKTFLRAIFTLCSLPCFHSRNTFHISLSIAPVFLQKFITCILRKPLYQTFTYCNPRSQKFLSVKHT